MKAQNRGRENGPTKGSESQGSFEPLPPLRAERHFASYTTHQVAFQPCGAAGLFWEMQAWFVRWYENEEVCRFEYEVASRYEALRHHPMFQREAAALRAAVEGLREFSALIHPIDGDDPQKRDHPRATAPWPVTGKGKVAA